jgi:hypothetical protein
VPDQPDQRRAAILKAVLDRTRAIESTRKPLLPLADAHQRVQDAAEPQPAATADSRPFTEALVDLAANCIVRLFDLAETEGTTHVR